MKLTQRQRIKIAGLIEDSLNSAKLNHLFIDDSSGDKYPLVDMLSVGSDDITDGQSEITNIVEQIYFDMDGWDI